MNKFNSFQEGQVTINIEHYHGAAHMIALLRQFILEAEQKSIKIKNALEKMDTDEDSDSKWEHIDLLTGLQEFHERYSSSFKASVQ